MAKKTLGMCVDKYNNVFVSDNTNGVLHLFSPEGAYMRNVFTQPHSAELTIDSCGNMWLYSDYGGITIYSYL
jgi:streptogramin lyase